MLTILLLLSRAGVGEGVGEVCRESGLIPYFCRTCTDKFEGLGYNPWIRLPDEPGLLINHKLTALVNNSCELYNPAAMCDPNKNMAGITFTMGGEGNAFIYVNFTDPEAFNFMDTTIYIQCESHDPPVCILATFVGQCPSEAFTMAAKVSISIVAGFIALLLVIVIGILAAFCVRRQWKNLPGKSEERKLLKYTQMD